MTRKSRINYLKAISHNVERKKMYKAKKQWVVAGLSFLVATGLGAFGSHLTTHADVNQTSTQTQKQQSPNSSASSGSTVNRPVQSASTELDTVQSSATNMYRGLMLKAATGPKSLNTSQQSVSGSDNVNNSAKSKVNQVSGKGRNNTDSTEATDNTSTSGSNQTSTKSEGQVSSTKSTKSNVNSNGSNNNNVPSSAPIHQKSSFNSAYDSYMAKMSDTDSEVTSANTINTDSNSNKNENNKVVLKDNAQPDYFSGGVTKTGTDDGLNYEVYKNGGVEFTDGTANSDLSDFGYKPHSVMVAPVNSDVCNAKAIKFDDNVDTSKVTNMSDMFDNLDQLTSLNLGDNFDTSNVTNMEDMFGGPTSLTSLNLGDSFDTRNVTNMECMFAYNMFLPSINLGNKFDTSNVTNMNSMFNGDSSLRLLNLGNKFAIPRDTNISDMFQHDPTMYKEVGGIDSNNNPYTLSTPNDFSKGNVGTFTVNKNPAPTTDRDTIQFNDIYSNIDGKSNPSDKSITGYGNGHLSSSDVPSGYALVDNNGKIVDPSNDTFTFNNGNHTFDVAPEDDGLTYKYDKANQSVEFTGGTANKNLSKFTCDGSSSSVTNSDISNANIIQFDKGVELNNSNITTNMLVGNTYSISNINSLHKIIINSSDVKFSNLGLPRQTIGIPEFSPEGQTIGQFLAAVYMDMSYGTTLNSAINAMSSMWLQRASKDVKEKALKALKPVNFYKVSDDGKHTSSAPNDFSQGNVGTFITTPHPKSDTIIYYQGNNKKNIVGQSQHMMTKLDSDNGTYSEVKVNNSNAKIPSNYHLVNSNNSNNGNIFNLDGGTYYVQVAPNDKTDTIDYHYYGSASGTSVVSQKYTGSDGGSFNVASNHSNLPSQYEIVSGADTSFSYNGSTYSVDVYNFSSASTQANNDVKDIVKVNSNEFNVSNTANGYAKSYQADSNSSAIYNQNSNNSAISNYAENDISLATTNSSNASIYASKVANDSKSKNEASASADLYSAGSYAASATSYAKLANGILKSFSDNTKPIPYNFGSAVSSANGVKNESVSTNSDNAEAISVAVNNYASNTSNDVNSYDISSQATKYNSNCSQISGLISQVDSANLLAKSYASDVSSASKARNGASANSDLSNATSAHGAAVSLSNAYSASISNLAGKMSDIITPINAISAKASSATANSDSKSASSYASDVNTDLGSATSDRSKAASDLKSASGNTDYKEISNLNSSDINYYNEISNDSTSASNDKSLASRYASSVYNDYYKKYNNSSNAGYLASKQAVNDSSSASYYRSLAASASTSASTALSAMNSIASQLSSGLALNTDSTEASQDSFAISNSDTTPASNDHTSAGQISNSASTENSSSMTPAESTAIYSSVSNQSSKDTSLSTAISKDSSTVSSASSAASSASSFINSYAKSMASGSTSVTSGMISSANSATSSASAAKSAADSAKNDANTKLGQMTSTNFSSLYIESSEASLDDSLANSYASNDAERISSIASGYNNSASNDLNGNDISYQNTTDNTHYGELTSSEASVNSFSNDVTADIASANSYTSAGNSASANNEESKASTDAASASQYLASVKDDYALITDMTKPVQKGTVISGDISDISHDSASTNSFMSNSNNSAHSVTSSEINYDSSVISSASNAASQDSTDQNMTDANTQKSLADSAYNNASEDALIESGIASDNNLHVYGVATVHLVYNVLQAGTKNIVSQTTKDVYIPINTRVNANSMTINPWNYSKSYYDQPHSDWTINFKPSDFKNFSGHLASDQFTNLSDNPTHTFTYNATQAGDVVVKYYSDIDNGNQHVNDPVKSDNLGNFDGLVGQQVTLTTSNVGTGDGIYGKLNVPAGYHLAHQLNTITLQAPSQAVSSQANVKNTGLLLMAPIVKNNTRDSNINKPAKSATTNNSSSNQAQSNEDNNSNVVIPNTPITTNITPTTSTSENNNRVDNDLKATNTPLQAITAQASHKLDEMNKPARIVKLVHHHSNNKNEPFYAHIQHAKVPVDKLPRVWTVHQLNKVGRGHTVRFGRVIITSLSGRHSYEFRILKHVYLHKKIYFTSRKFHSLKPSYKAIRIHRIFLVQQGKHTYIRLELRLNHHTYFITGQRHYVKRLYR